MRQKAILPGTRFHKLVIVNEVERTQPKHRRFLCRCDCGREKHINLDCLVTGNTLSCGCVRNAGNRLKSMTHGESRSSEYRIWIGMINRCTKPGKAFDQYGGRGIKVCDRWLSSFENFLEDMGRRPSSKHSIDRIDNDGGYEPSNCRWATPSQQGNNTRQTTMITVDGVTKPLSEWSRLTGAKADTIRFRINRGWSPRLAITGNPAPGSSELPAAGPDDGTDVR